MRRVDHKSAGFTLIEVLVALAIAGLGMALLLAATGAGIDNSTEAARHVQATSLAQSRLAQVGRTLPLKNGEYDGEEGNGFRWHVHVGAPAVHGTAALYPVTVTESWKNGMRQKRLSLYSERVASP
jgi:type II secretion system protein I